MFRESRYSAIDPFAKQVADLTFVMYLCLY
jgi:hypothetical protein